MTYFLPGHGSSFVQKVVALSFSPLELSTLMHSLPWRWGAGFEQFRVRWTILMLSQGAWHWVQADHRLQSPWTLRKPKSQWSYGGIYIHSKDILDASFKFFLPINLIVCTWSPEKCVHKIISQLWLHITGFCCERLENIMTYCRYIVKKRDLREFVNYI